MWEAVLAGIGIVSSLVALIGWIIRTLLRSLLESQKQFFKVTEGHYTDIKEKLEALITHVNVQNGRVGKLEVRSDNVDKQLERIYDSERSHSQH